MAIERFFDNGGDNNNTLDSVAKALKDQANESNQAVNKAIADENCPGQPGPAGRAAAQDQQMVGGVQHQLYRDAGDERLDAGHFTEDLMMNVQLKNNWQNWPWLEQVIIATQRPHPLPTGWRKRSAWPNASR